jgi:hypothetical protein
MIKSQLPESRQSRKPKQPKAKPAPAPVLNWIAPKSPQPDATLAGK